MNLDSILLETIYYSSQISSEYLGRFSEHAERPPFLDSMMAALNLGLIVQPCHLIDSVESGITEAWRQYESLNEEVAFLTSTFGWSETDVPKRLLAELGTLLAELCHKSTTLAANAKFCSAISNIAKELPQWFANPLSKNQLTPSALEAQVQKRIRQIGSIAELLEQYLPLDSARQQLDVLWGKLLIINQLTEADEAVRDSLSSAVFPTGINLSLSAEKYKNAARKLFEVQTGFLRQQALQALFLLSPDPSDEDLFADGCRQFGPPALTWSAAGGGADRVKNMIVIMLEDAVNEPSGTFREKNSLNPRGQLVNAAITSAVHYASEYAFVTHLQRIVTSSPTTDFQGAAMEALISVIVIHKGTAYSFLSEFAQNELVILSQTITGKPLSVLAKAVLIGYSGIPDQVIENLAARINDESLGYDRLDIFRILIKRSESSVLRDLVAKFAVEPGCRCGGCFWRQSLRLACEEWPDEQSRELMESTLDREPSYEGKIQAIKILADQWPDERTISLLKAQDPTTISSKGEGADGHRPNQAEEEQRIVYQRHFQNEIKKTIGLLRRDAATIKEDEANRRKAEEENNRLIQLMIAKIKAGS